MNDMARPRVLLADDHRIVAEGLRSLLSAKYELVGEVEDGRALLGAAGYVLKHSAPAELVTAIEAALAGKTYLTLALTGEVLQAMQHGVVTI